MWWRYPSDDSLEHRLDSKPRLCADPQNLVLLAIEQGRELFDGCLATTIVLDKIPLVD